MHRKQEYRYHLLYLSQSLATMQHVCMYVCMYSMRVYMYIDSFKKYQDSPFLFSGIRGMLSVAGDTEDSLFLVLCRIGWFCERDM